MKGIVNEAMTGTESTEIRGSSLTRNVQSMVRRYVGNRRAVLVVAIAAVAGGLALNWNWLVAIGVGALPCLVMCAFGVCMMCRSSKTHSAASRDAADRMRSTAGGVMVMDMDRPSVSGTACCRGKSGTTLSPQMKQSHSTDERKVSHA